MKCEDFMQFAYDLESLVRLVCAVIPDLAQLIDHAL